MRSRSRTLCCPAPRWVARSVCSTSRRRYTTTHREQYAQTIHFAQFATLSYPCLFKGLWSMITNPFSLFFTVANAYLLTLVLRVLLFKLICLQNLQIRILEYCSSSTYLHVLNNLHACKCVFKQLEQVNFKL